MAQGCRLSPIKHMSESNEKFQFLKRERVDLIFFFEFLLFT